MARSLKTRGLIELNALKARVRRQKALERISRTDEEWLLEKLDEIEARISEMHERGDDLDI